MKKIFLLLFCIFSFSFAFSYTILGGKAPSFTAQTTEGKIHFPSYYKGKWIILFSFPNVFTPLCTQEIIKFIKLSPTLKDLNCEVIGISTNTNSIHLAWLATIRQDLQKEEGKAVKIDFPLIDDSKKSIAKRYGMLHPKVNKNKTVRSVFFIDPTGKIRAIFLYPITNGRNFQELTRLLTAMQAADKEKGVTPPDWEKGSPTIPCPACHNSK